MPFNNTLGFLGDDDGGIDWGDVINSAAGATARIFTAKYAAQAAKSGASPYAVQSILNTGGTPGLPSGYGYNAAGQIIGPGGTVAGLAGGIGAGAGSIFDNLSRSLGISTSTLLLVLGGAALLYLLPSPRGRR